MNDFFAAFPACTKEQLQRIVDNPPARHAPSVAALLAQTTAREETKLEGQRIYRDLTESAPFREELKSSMRLMENLGLIPPLDVSLENLPPYSFYLRIDFALASPFLSRDDRAFSVTENPVRKDHVFGLPMVSSTTWKGAVRSACLAQCDKQRVDALFGPDQENAEEIAAFKGRLFFYPSFFSTIGFEMFNPHDRKTRVGTNPIAMECVPAGARSRFALLYAPIYLKHPLKPAEIADDLQAVAESCQRMMLESGFSAKKSSGYGAVAPKAKGLEGEITVSSLAERRHRVGSVSELLTVGERICRLLKELE